MRVNRGVEYVSRLSIEFILTFTLVCVVACQNAHSEGREAENNIDRNQHILDEHTFFKQVDFLVFLCDLVQEVTGADSAGVLPSP